MKTWIVLLLAVAFRLDGQDIMLVKQRAGTEPTRAAAFHRSEGASPTYLRHVGWSIVQMPRGQEKRLSENYRRSGLFEKCESNRVYRSCAVPNDPLYPLLWGMRKIQAEQGWATATSNGVIVAVIDTGVDFDHPDIAANLWTGPGGEHGYTALYGELFPGGRDDFGHGTHVAGIIGAVGNNGLGVVGIAWRTQILSLKFLNSQGYGYTADAALCIDRMIALKLAGHNIRVANNSWGSSGLDVVLEDAFRAAEEAGILSVCAAGNSFQNTDIAPFSPANLPVESIISVVASDENDGKAAFSNYGDTSTDLLAPGVGIVSLNTNGGYQSLSGTSMASPQVAGVAAAIFGLNGSLTVAQAKNVLLNPDSLDQTAFVHTSTFGGRLNMAKALTNGLIYAPQDNHPPTLTVFGSTRSLRVGESTTVSASASDADGDALRYTVSLRAASDTLGQEFPVRFLNGNTISVTNPGTSAIAIGLEARFTASDGKGGTAFAVGRIFMEGNPALQRQLTADLSVRPTASYPFAETVVASNVSSNEADYALFSSGYQYPIFATCCFPVNTGYPWYGGSQTGPNIVRGYAVDRYGNLANSQRLIIDHTAGGIYVPEVKVSLNTTRGRAPLMVRADMSATDPDGSHGLRYFSRLWSSGSLFERSPPFDPDVFDPMQTFSLTNLGTTAMEFVAYDASTDLVDKVVRLFTVLPSGPRMTASISGQTITLNWDTPTANDVLQSSSDLRNWAAVKTGLPPVNVQMQNGIKAFRVQQ